MYTQLISENKELYVISLLSTQRAADVHLFFFFFMESLISHTLYHDIVVLTNFVVQPISEGFDFPTFNNKNLLISVLWWTWSAWCQTSKAPNNEESLFVKLAKHLGVVV